jgi:tetratricopeptide (TPR) repeat protein
VFAIQDEISRSIVAALRSALVPEGSMAAAGTSNFEASQLLLRGRHFWSLRGESNIRQSIQMLTRAIELDPDFAQAHATLAAAYATTTFYYEVPERNALDVAARGAERAMALDPTLSEPYAVQGMIAEQRQDWPRAEERFRRAVELNRNDATARYWLGELHYVTGRTDEALAVMLEAVELDPILQPLLNDIGDLYVDKGGNETGCGYLRRVTQISARMRPWLGLARCHERAGDLAAAAEVERTAERNAGIEPPIMALVRRAVADSAENAAARAALREASQGGRYFVHYQRLLGDFDGAFDVIEAQLRQGNYNSLRELWHPDAADLRAHPRFRELVTRVGLVDYWRQSKWPDVCAPNGDGFRCE